MYGVRLGRHFSKHTCWAWAWAATAWGAGARGREPSGGTAGLPGGARPASIHFGRSLCSLPELGEIPGEGLLCGQMCKQEAFAGGQLKVADILLALRENGLLCNCYGKVLRKGENELEFRPQPSDSEAKVACGAGQGRAV